MAELESAERREALLESIAPEQAGAQLDLLRAIFRREMAYRAEDEEQEFFENLYHCAFLLFCAADPADVPVMLAAKRINMDIDCGFDTEFLLGPGLAASVVALRQAGQEDFARELEARAGEFGPEAMARWVAFRRKYFYGKDGAT